MEASFNYRAYSIIFDRIVSWIFVKEFGAQLKNAVS